MLFLIHIFNDFIIKLGLLGGRLLSHKPPSRDDAGESSHSGFYGCGQTCHYVTTRYGFKCPKHKKLMETQYKIVDEEGNLRSQVWLSV